MMIDKAVPILLRNQDGVMEILVFDHPLAGRQLVKGTIEPGEDVEAAAVRELWEESGIGSVSRTIILGTETYAEIGQRWHFVLCESAEQPPERWENFTQDGGGLIFRFLWQPLQQPIKNPIGQVFDAARRFILSELDLNL